MLTVHLAYAHSWCYTPCDGLPLSCLCFCLCLPVCVVLIGVDYQVQPNACSCCQANTAHLYWYPLTLPLSILLTRPLISLVSLPLSRHLSALFHTACFTLPVSHRLSHCLFFHTSCFLHGLFVHTACLTLPHLYHYSSSHSLPHCLTASLPGVVRWQLQALC